MKKILALLIMATSVASAEVPAGGIWALYSSCDVSAGYFLNPGSGAPRTDCQYPLGNVVVAQKIKGGYLLRPDFALGDTGTGALFLRTDAELPKGLRWAGEIKVRPAGTHEYQGIDGFTKTAWMFDPVMAKDLK